VQAILARQSIRKYTDQPITDEQIHTLLAAGMSAPSAHNEAPWYFLVLNERMLLNEIPKVHPHAQMLKWAQTAILVCADLNLEKDKGSGYWIQDCAAATENILIAAHAMGLGACWVGIHPRPERKEALQKVCHLPENVVAFSMVALGVPDEVKVPSDRFNPERVCYNRWS